MKRRILFTIFTALMILTLTSCATLFGGKSSDISTNGKKLSTVEQIHLLAEESMDTTTSKDWTLKYFVDKFGDKTDEVYLSYEARGTFSNSATSGSRLYVRVMVKEQQVYLELHEYNDNDAAVDFDKSYYTIVIKDESGNEKKIDCSTSGTVSSNERKTRLVFTDKKAVALYNYLFSGEAVKFYMNGDWSSSYNFTIDTTGFTQAYKEGFMTNESSK